MNELKRGREELEPPVSRTTTLEIPDPRDNERPTAYADRVGEWYVAQKTDEHRRNHGLYLTPVAVADFMATHVRADAAKLRILDPAAGGGVLCCAAVEAVVSETARPNVIELVAYEVDFDLHLPLNRVLDYLSYWCQINYNITISASLRSTDFVLDNAGVLERFYQSLDFKDNDRDFDIVISNPPYFKIGKADPRARAAARIVHGQPNIYSIFMAISTALLRANGAFVFITPRSFSSGPYFQKFRKFFFDKIRLTGVHVFRSRREAFKRDAVLQENIIVAGVREDSWQSDNFDFRVIISSSRGISDLSCPQQRSVVAESIVDFSSKDRVLRLPLCETDANLLTMVDAWPCTLHSLGLNISTGPVVPFRATAVIDNNGYVPQTHVPLYWMNHVRAMQVTWPMNRHKPEYIRRKGTRSLLVANSNYVLLRRFSAKEEPRRLTAAPYIADSSAAAEVGLENHLNYIHRPGGTLSEDETWGLAALYNSNLLDRYFRCVNGNTQVSATELRAMRLPEREIIVKLGCQVRSRKNPMESLDSLVTELVNAPKIREVRRGSY